MKAAFFCLLLRSFCCLFFWRTRGEEQSQRDAENFFLFQKGATRENKEREREGASARSLVGRSAMVVVLLCLCCCGCCRKRARRLLLMMMMMRGMQLLPYQSACAGADWIQRRTRGGKGHACVHARLKKKRASSTPPAFQTTTAPNVVKKPPRSCVCKTAAKTLATRPAAAHNAASKCVPRIFFCVCQKNTKTKSPEPRARVWASDESESARNRESARLCTPKKKRRRWRQAQCGRTCVCAEQRKSGSERERGEKNRENKIRARKMGDAFSDKACPLRLFFQCGNRGEKKRVRRPGRPWQTHMGGADDRERERRLVQKENTHAWDAGVRAAGPGGCIERTGKCSTPGLSKVSWGSIVGR